MRQGFCWVLVASDPNRREGTRPQHHVPQDPPFPLPSLRPGTLHKGKYSLTSKPGAGLGTRDQSTLGFYWHLLAAFRSRVGWHRVTGASTPRLAPDVTSSHAAVGEMRHMTLILPSKSLQAHQTPPSLRGGGLRATSWRRYKQRLMNI